MILDHRNNANLYVGLNSGFAKAFEFLKRSDIAQLSAGRHEIDGDRVYAMVSSAPGNGRETAKLEAHRRYIDIQYAIAGTDVIGWKPIHACIKPENEFDVDKDLILYQDAADVWVDLLPETFVVLFPEDAHAPMAGDGHLHKVVVKIAVE